MSKGKKSTPLHSLGDIQGLKVTIMGLGLHGGGLASAKFFYDRGAAVTVTDLRDEATLKPSIDALGCRNIRYVLGRHELADFSGADIVIKNPAVRKASIYLDAARCIESDISVFLRFSASPLVAVTGTKGKSTTASAIHHGFVASGIKALLGGNITVSPLSFLDEACPGRPVVLELSSWQLADMKGLGVLKPKVAVLTAIMPDHMNYYHSMDEYVADKRLVYADQDANDFTICDNDSDWGRSFAAESHAKILMYGGIAHGKTGGWLDSAPGGLHGLSNVDPTGSSEAWCAKGWPARSDWPAEIVPSNIRLPGPPMKKNLLAAGLALQAMGVDPVQISSAMGSFPGIEHRMEWFAEANGIQWYNDSAATVPQAVSAALDSFDVPVTLITGGTDKNLDFEPVKAAYLKADQIILLEGTGTDKLIPLLKEQQLSWHGPYGDLVSAVKKANEITKPGSVVILSPGCASFGMFLHEFDRGRKFKECVLSTLGKADDHGRSEIGD
ncbi:MAG: UDP-N-acetylmuramoyl-L-alanine--D-glutamate ligase [Spirochaetaceae bacterium]|nr:UDP-N-acetylmuramoyl-L-alanine--D-glutamate ligase [Spirochaetaceae bacterium]